MRRSLIGDLFFRLILKWEAFTNMYELPKDIILRDKQEFNRVYTKGSSHMNKWLVIHVMHSSNTKGKVGFTVGKKIGNAVTRNRIKRLMREVYRIHQHKILPEVSVILIGRQSLINANFNNIIKAFIDVCKKAKILKRSSYK